MVLDTLLNCEDVARILGISLKTVHKLVRERKLGCVQVTSKERRFTEEQVDDYIASRTVPGPIDKVPLPPISSPKKGGEKSSGVSRAELRKELSSWR